MESLHNKVPYDDSQPCLKPIPLNPSIVWKLSRDKDAARVAVSGLLSRISIQCGADPGL
ncbi:hypothetical protein J6590_004126 [Homalodisca vitripennis]|nr:hypothetical protein J6590_004126 [Homalodisca vitripennis]